ncbi:HlyD family type I secretion periplasmic adaptor subunit [Acetobacteraceae bacterium H6797]|nr:HlyD family type I secretion periplasmic adaptor subunit [Acetobacteraceae bacterium H6797]
MSDVTVPSGGKPVIELPDRANRPLIQLDAPRPHTRGPMLLGIAAMAIFIGGFGAWSAYAPLAEAAIAQGVIKVEGNRRTIQHLEGGIVREILVRDGDQVQAGQVLMRLDDIQASSALEATRGQRWAYLAQDARLAAEMARADRIAFPAEMLSSSDPRAREAMSGQQALFELRKASLQSQIQVLQTRISQQDASQASSEAQRLSQERQLTLTRREEQDVRTLVAQGLERMPRLLALQRNIASAEGNIADLNFQIERAKAQSAEARSQMKQIEDQRLAEVSSEMRDVRIKLNDAEEKLRAANDVSKRREIVAPESGTILNSRFFTIGAVVRAGDPVMEMTPSSDKLVADVQLAPNDIDVVHPGLLAEVRLPAFKQRLVPYLHGHVEVVAADVTQDDRTRQSYYSVKIQIDPEQLKALSGVELKPGMPVEAHIKVGERSFFRYMVQPLIDSFHRAFTEQ